jgi:Zn-dependent protease/CBS domain-containing protein
VHPEQTTAAYWAAGLLATLLFFASLLVHELSHSLVARHAGLEVPSITLFLFGGASEMAREPDDPRTELRIAVVGPLASFALAGLFGLASIALTRTAEPPEMLHAVVGYLGWINLALGVFNLLPGLPLDGGRVLRAVVWWRTGSRLRGSQVASRAGRGLGIGLAILGGLQIFGGALLGGVWLILIGLFLRGLAQASYQSLVLRQSLEDATVRDVMVRDPVTVSPDLPLQQLVEDYVLSHGYRGFPVVDGDRVLGIVSIDGIRSVEADKRATTPVRERLEPLEDARCIEPGASLSDAFERMSRSGERRLLVMQGGDRLVGLLTWTGLVRFLEIRQVLGGQDEELALPKGA